MDKSYVTIEQKQCPVCGTIFDTGNILLNKHLRESFDYKTVTGQALCPKDQQLYDQGYIALIGCDTEKSKVTDGVIKNPEDAYRTGEIAHMKVEAFNKMFDKQVDTKNMIPYVYTESEVFEKLREFCTNEI